MEPRKIKEAIRKKRRISTNAKWVISIQTLVSFCVLFPRESIQPSIVVGIPVGRHLSADWFFGTSLAAAFRGAAAEAGQQWNDLTT
jgi:hypothetical protein